MVMTDYGKLEKFRLNLLVVINQLIKLSISEILGITTGAGVT